MHITILPATPELRDVIRKHGADGWIVLQNIDKCPSRNGRPATLVSKNNQMKWLVDTEMRVR